MTSSYEKAWEGYYASHMYKKAEPPIPGAHLYHTINYVHDPDKVFSGSAKSSDGKVWTWMMYKPKRPEPDGGWSATSHYGLRYYHNDKDELHRDVGPAIEPISDEAERLLRLEKPELDDDAIELLMETELKMVFYAWHGKLIARKDIPEFKQAQEDGTVEYWLGVREAKRLSNEG